MDRDDLIRIVGRVELDEALYVVGRQERLLIVVAICLYRSEEQGAVMVSLRRRCLLDISLSVAGAHGVEVVLGGIEAGGRRDHAVSVNVHLYV